MQVPWGGDATVARDEPHRVPYLLVEGCGDVQRVQLPIPIHPAAIVADRLNERARQPFAGSRLAKSTPPTVARTTPWASSLTNLILLNATWSVSPARELAYRRHNSGSKVAMPVPATTWVSVDLTLMWPCPRSRLISADAMSRLLFPRRRKNPPGERCTARPAGTSTTSTPWSGGSGVGTR